jgi:hypothetical protein
MDAMAGKGSITVVCADRVVHDALLGERIFDTCMPLTLLEKKRFHSMCRCADSKNCYAFLRGPQIQVLCNLNSLVIGGVLVNRLSVNVPFNLFAPGTVGESS